MDVRLALPARQAVEKRHDQDLEAQGAFDDYGGTDRTVRKRGHEKKKNWATTEIFDS
jgi:hypothetical protein